MKRVVIESPYAGDVAGNVQFCLAVCRFAVRHGRSPYASHLLFTQFLDDAVPEERQLGIDAGLAWNEVADEVWFCLREGEEMSRGMKYALERHQRDERRIFHIRFKDDGTPTESQCEICGDATKFTMAGFEKAIAPCGPCVLSIVCP